MGRRIRGEGGFYQRADGVWIGVIDLGVHGGRRIRKTVSGKTKAIAQTRFKELKKELEKGGGLSADISVEEWMNHWFEFIASERNKATTLQSYRGYINNWIIPYLGKYRLTKLNEDHIRALYRAMKDKGLADSSRHQVHSILRRALVIAEREKRVTRNPAAMVDPPPQGKNYRLPLSLEQARQVLASLDDDPLQARWVAALLLGMRQGECLGLEWNDIDFKTGLIEVRQGQIRISHKGLLLDTPKSTNAFRSLPIIEPMRFALARTERRGDFVFYGKPTQPKADWTAWKKLLIRSGVCPADMPFGEMPALACARTTTATLLRDAGVPDTVIRDILGHAQVQITQQSYMRTDQPTLEAGMKALENKVNPN
jgi:integrase